MYKYAYTILILAGFVFAKKPRTQIQFEKIKEQADEAVRDLGEKFQPLDRTEFNAAVCEIAGSMVAKILEFANTLDDVANRKRMPVLSALSQCIRPLAGSLQNKLGNVSTRDIRGAMSSVVSDVDTFSKQLWNLKGDKVLFVNGFKAFVTEAIEMTMKVQHAAAGRYRAGHGFEASGSGSASRLSHEQDPSSPSTKKPRAQIIFDNIKKSADAIVIELGENLQPSDRSEFNAAVCEIAGNMVTKILHFADTLDEAAHYKQMPVYFALSECLRPLAVSLQSKLGNVSTRDIHDAMSSVVSNAETFSKQLWSLEGDKVAFVGGFKVFIAGASEITENVQHAAAGRYHVGHGIEASGSGSASNLLHYQTVTMANRIQVPIFSSLSQCIRPLAGSLKRKLGNVSAGDIRDAMSSVVSDVDTLSKQVRNFPNANSELLAAFQTFIEEASAIKNNVEDAAFGRYHAGHGRGAPVSGRHGRGAPGSGGPSHEGSGSGGYGGGASGSGYHYGLQ